MIGDDVDTLPTLQSAVTICSYDQLSVFLFGIILMNGTCFCSADLEDLWRRSKLVLLLVLVAGRLEKLVGEVSGLFVLGN